MQSTSEFNKFLDSSNQFGPILLGHFIAIEMIISPILAREWGGHFLQHQFAVRRKWFGSILKGLEVKMHIYLTWPASIVALAAEGLMKQTLQENRLVSAEI
jgi:hypothetical protein